MIAIWPLLCIGMEVAAYLVGKALSVECIGNTAIPLERVFGERIGKMFQEMHEAKGVTFHMGSGVTEITGDQGKVTGVKLSSGETVEADVVVAGVGELLDFGVCPLVSTNFGFYLVAHVVVCCLEESVSVLIVLLYRSSTSHRVPEGLWSPSHSSRGGHSRRGEQFILAN